MQRLWSFMYALSLGLSSIAAASIARSVHRHAEVRSSAVRFVFFFFFFYLWLWSVFRGIFYLDMFHLDEATPAKESGREEDEKTYFDALGLYSVAQDTTLTRPWLSFVLVMGDTALVASSLWMLPMTWELSRLARRSMDRGLKGERAVVRLHCKWVHTLIVVFLIGEASFTIQNSGFNSRSYRVLISGNMIQGITLVYVVYILIKLKWTGRKYEMINGAVVPSPLYKRLKGIMFVFGMFSFQYQIISLILLFSRFSIELPTHVIGISTLLFNNTGTALSIVLGFSQECMFRSFRRYLPRDYTAGFVVAEPLLPPAMSNSPPLVNPVFVFTDIECSSELWGLDHGVTMKAANEQHDEIMRTSLAKYRGYEIATCGDAFQLAFHSVRDAIEFCIEVQLRLVSARWPTLLHNRIPATKRQHDKRKNAIFNGLRVRMGVHDAQEVDGVLVNGIHPVTGKVTYTGLSEVIAHDIGEVGAGGEICVTKRVALWLQRNAETVAFAFEVDLVGEHRVDQLDIVLDIFDVIPLALKSRKPAFQEYWGKHKEDLISVVVQKSPIQSVHDWSSASVDVVESNYTFQ